MDALNMLTLMYASTEVSNAQNQGQAQVAGQPGQPGVEFALLLQQQLWVNSLPQCMQGEAATESTGLFNLDLSDMTVLVGEQPGACLQTVGGALAGSTGETGTALTLSDLLAALLSELEQILGVLEEVSATTSQTTSGGTAVEATEGTALSGKLAGLISAWNQVIEQLNTFLADETNGLYTVSATNLTEQPARPTATLLPWSSVPAAENTGGTTTLTTGTSQVAATGTAAEPNQAVAGPTGTGALALADDSGGELPQSIRWFQTVGIIATRAKPVTVNVPQPQVVSTTVDLGNGETGQLTLAENTGKLPGAAQAYSLRLDVPGAETSLTATLTVVRMDVLPTAETRQPLVGQPAQTVAQVMPGVEYTAPTVPDLAGQVPLPTGIDGPQAQPLGPAATAVPDGAALTAPRPELVQEATPNPVAVSRPAITIATERPQAVVASLVNVEAVPVAQSLVEGQALVPGRTDVTIASDPVVTDARLMATEAVELTIDPVQVSSEVVKFHPGMSEVPVRFEAKPVQTSTASDTAKAVAVPVTDTVVDAAAVDRQAVETRAWSTDHALENLGLSTGTLEALESVMSRTGEPLTLERSEPATTMTSVTQLVDALAQPQLTMNTDSLPLQLLQYSQASQTASTYNGLQYLEMAERIMEQVNTVRQGSGGFYQARLALNPPNLGEMFVNISVRGDAVALQLCVVSTVPREQLKDSLASLRESLEEAGLYVTEIRVEEIHEQGGDAGRDSGSESGTDNADSETTQARKTSPVVNEVITSTGSQRMVPAVGFN